jgi:hypothetical protein
MGAVRAPAPVLLGAHQLPSTLHRAGVQIRLVGGEEEDMDDVGAHVGSGASSELGDAGHRRVEGDSDGEGVLVVLPVTLGIWAEAQTPVLHLHKVSAAAVLESAVHAYAALLRLDSSLEWDAHRQRQTGNNCAAGRSSEWNEGATDADEGELIDLVGEAVLYDSLAGLCSTNALIQHELDRFPRCMHGCMNTVLDSAQQGMELRLLRSSKECAWLLGLAHTLAATVAARSAAEVAEEFEASNEGTGEPEMDRELENEIDQRASKGAAFLVASGSSVERVLHQLLMSASPMVTGPAVRVVDAYLDLAMYAQEGVPLIAFVDGSADGGQEDDTRAAADELCCLVLAFELKRYRQRQQHRRPERRLLRLLCESNLPWHAKSLPLAMEGERVLLLLSSL